MIGTTDHQAIKSKLNRLQVKLGKAFTLPHNFCSKVQVQFDYSKVLTDLLLAFLLGWSKPLWMIIRQVKQGFEVFIRNLNFGMVHPNIQCLDDEQMSLPYFSFFKSLNNEWSLQSLHWQSPLQLRQSQFCDSLSF